MKEKSTTFRKGNVLALVAVSNNFCVCIIIAVLFFAVCALNQQINKPKK
jgi:hypothetical protein